MRTALLRSGLAAVSMFCTTAVPAIAQGQAGAQGPFVAAGTSSGREAVDRRVDESLRQTQAARQTEAPKPVAAQRAPDSSARGESKPAFGRQPDPVRLPDPPRQRGPERQVLAQRHSGPSHQGGSDHWQDPGPAWRPLGPAWGPLNDRPGVERPTSDAFRPGAVTHDQRDRGGKRDSRRDDRRHTGGNDGFYGYPYVAPFAFGPYYPYYSTVEFEPEPAPEPAPEAVEEPPLGFLQLRVLPRNADVFVDGALAGTVDDFGGRGARMLPAGPHHIEISAPGYESVTFDVRVPANDTVTFTRDLDRIGERPVPEPIVVPHKAMYVVPMCYIGDRPPTLSDMPAGCRVEDVRVLP